MKTKTKLMLGGGVAFVGAVASYYVWDAQAHPMLVEARHYASTYNNEIDEIGRCASADLAAAYYRKGSDHEKFEEWKVKADAHCPSQFPHAYYSAQPVSTDQ
jgi:hypothetical protein